MSLKDDPSVEFECLNPCTQPSDNVTKLSFFWWRSIIKFGLQKTRFLCNNLVIVKHFNGKVFFKRHLETKSLKNPEKNSRISGCGGVTERSADVIVIRPFFFDPRVK